MGSSLRVHFSLWVGRGRTTTTTKWRGDDWHSTCHQAMAKNLTSVTILLGFQKLRWYHRSRSSYLDKAKVIILSICCCTWLLAVELMMGKNKSITFRCASWKCGKFSGICLFSYYSKILSSEISHQQSFKVQFSVKFCFLSFAQQHSYQLPAHI
jgi:hypothetical protein